MRKPYAAWFKEVNAVVAARVGLSVYDLPDCPFMDWYAAGVSAKSAAARAIKNAAD